MTNSIRLLALAIDRLAEPTHRLYLRSPQGVADKSCGVSSQKGAYATNTLPMRRRGPQAFDGRALPALTGVGKRPRILKGDG